MHIVEPVSLTALYIDQDSMENKYKTLVNANIQDYMDSLKQGGELEVRAGKLKQKITGLASGIGMAAGVFGGPAGIALGFSVGNVLGKYAGNVLSSKMCGQAMTDVSEISHDAKLRHAQLASYLAFLGQVGGAIDTLRQNENKRKKDDLQAMQV